MRRRGLLMAAVAGLVLAGTLPLRPVVAQEASAPEAQHREMELQRYRDAVRRHFVLKEYEELLELTDKYGHLYPEDKGTEFYRTQAEIRMEESEKEIPFERLQDREFQIPGADAGQPSLLDELRNGSPQSESGPTGTANLTVEPGDDSQVAMGTPPGEEERASPFEAPADTETEPGAPVEEPEPAVRETAPEAAAEATPAPRGDEGAGAAAVPPSPEQAAGATETADSGGSPLPLILGGAVLILGGVAAFLLIGMVRRRGKRSEAAEEEAPAAAPQEPPAPPLFNFEDSEGSEAGGAASEFDETFEAPEALGETGVAQGAEAPPAEESAGGGEPASIFDESAPEESGPPEALGETRGAEEVNQEISDLLFAPESESAEDSVFGADSESPAEPPPPLGETKTEETAFGEPSDDTSDLVQIPDDSSVNLDSSSDVDSLFAEASPAEEKPAEPAPAEESAAAGGAAEETPAEPEPKPAPEAPDETSVGEQSSIDLFGDESPGESDKAPEASGGADGSGEAESTSNVGMDEFDAMIGETGGSSSGEVGFSEASAEGGGQPEGVEIPFAMEDPFQNLSGETQDAEPQSQDEETAFNTSTAETMAAEGADTGVEERELLEVIEQGDGETQAGSEAPPSAQGGEEDVWSGLETDPQQEKQDKPEKAEDEVQSFREDETAAFEIEGGDETEPPPSTSEPQVTNPEAETVVPSGSESSSPGDLPDDPFDRERQRGDQAVEAGDWTKAVYHLSIAASLKPEANDVRETLRHARKMKKEQQTG